jgi:hypothetical protein
MLLVETQGVTHLTLTDRYAAYMLRMQRTKNDQQPTWIVSMQSTKTGDQRWFPSLEALVAFLRYQR